MGLVYDHSQVTYTLTRSCFGIAVKDCIFGGTALSVGGAGTVVRLYRAWASSHTL